MKTLHLLRHAKSSWKEDVEDHERPLSPRGREAARRVGKHLVKTIGPLDLVLCSTALRTRQTLELVVGRYAVPPRILIEDDLYAASREGLMDRLSRVSEEQANVLVIAHNPGIHELALALAQTGSPGLRALACGKFPTAARASFQVCGPWSQLALSRHRLVDYVTPASLAGGKG
ncbi:MAG: histidine phosphatase family protein [Alphaproteobacteria bacterium]|nr:histidine phosphatase family protein [Alphaproteobacteria bacterium]